MLTIRPDQVQLFEGVALRHFVHRAADYLERRFPKRALQLGRAAVLESVRVAVARGEAHGLVAELHVVQYLNLMYRLGFEFEADASWAWVRAILADPALTAGEKLARIRSENPDV